MPGRAVARPRGAPRRRPRRDRRGRARARRRRCSSASATVVGDLREADPAVEERRDGHLVGRVVRARVRAAALPRLARERQQREASRASGASKRSSSPAARSSGSAGTAARSGIGERERDRHAHVRAARGARAARRRGSGRASARPRSDARRPRSGRTGMPNSQCASISSRPLFASVAESTVIFRPIDQVGCARASVDRDVRRARPATRPRNGPPDAVRTSDCDRVGSTSLEALEERRVLAVDRQEQPAAASVGGDGELAGGDEALLVRERERDAALERPERRLDAGEADDRVEDDVRLARVEEVGTPSRRPGRARRRERRRARRAAACRTCSAQSSSSGFAPTISIACAPIEPVAPRRATRFIDAGCLTRDGVTSARGRRRSAAGPAQRSESTRSRTPPWPARTRPESFTPRSRLIADSKRSPSVEENAIAAPSASGFEVGEEPLVVHREERDRHRRDRAADEPLPRLPRRDPRRHLVAADRAADEVGGRVVGEDRDQHGEHDQPPVLRDRRAGG